MKGENYFVIFFLMITAILSLYIVPVYGPDRIGHLIFLMAIVVVGGLGLLGVYIQSNTGLIIEAIAFGAVLMNSVLMLPKFSGVFLLIAGASSTIGLIYSVLLIGRPRSTPVKVAFSKKRHLIEKEIGEINIKKPTVIIEDYNIPKPTKKVNKIVKKARTVRKPTSSVKNKSIKKSTKSRTTKKTDRKAKKVVPKKTKKPAKSKVKKTAKRASKKKAVISKKKL
ncbi:hypothetical protein K9M79_01660 [Candidatus Woesearchaeota archaeon]|nr:hypothetical protein [Candidatus Woesearchaeota archaeon]